MKHLDYLIRIALASVFLFHGIGKFMDISMLQDMMINTIGMPDTASAWMLANFVAAAEVFAGILILLPIPILTSIGSLIMLAVLGTAIYFFHWPQWSFATSATHPLGGMEFQVTMMLSALYLFLKNCVLLKPFKSTKS